MGTRQTKGTKSILQSDIEKILDEENFITNMANKSAEVFVGFGTLFGLASVWTIVVSTLAYGVKLGIDPKAIADGVKKKVGGK